MNREKYIECLAEAEILIEADPLADSDDGKRLIELAGRIEKYEHSLIHGICNQDFWKWMVELNLLFTKAAGYEIDMADECGWECWFESFDDGLSPYHVYWENITAG